MPIAIDLSVILTVLVAAAALALVAWFFLGMQWNLARGNSALRWLKDGLTVLAEKTTLRWLGSSAVQLGINNPHAPFKQIDVLVVLEPRDVALIWLMTRRQGRRDMLVVRGHLRRPARCEFDYLDPASWSGKDALAHHTPAGWQKTNDGAYLLAAESIEAAAIVREILPIVQRMGTPLLRLSARRTVPHLEIHVASPWTAGVAGREAMQAVKEAGNLLLPQK